jgi:hypothetical protein
LTVVDAQHHTAYLSLIGDYTNSTFNLSNDGSGGTLVIDPPKDSFDFAPVPTPQTPSIAPAVMAARLGSDGFIFDQAAPVRDPHSGAAEAFNAGWAKPVPVADSGRSDSDPGIHHVELVHFLTPADAHFANFHSFMLH